MSIFYCPSCQQLRDSDEGCEEVNGELVCQRCADRHEEAEEELKQQRMTEMVANK